MAKIAFLISDPGISGGINVVFRHAIELLGTGATVAIVCDRRIERPDVAWHPISALFGTGNLLWLDHAEVVAHHFDMALATWWRTFFDLWKIRADRYAYFVQSIESRFYPPEDRVLRAAVEATYEAPVGFITEARWIQRYLQRVHGRTAELAVNGVDKSIYRVGGETISPRMPGRLRVLVEGPVDVAFKNVPLSIRLAREGGAEEVWLLTSSPATSVEGVDRVFSRLTQAQTAAVYRSCDVLLKLSTVEGMFGPPLEMFHCGGTAIVYDVTGREEYIEHGRNALVARMHDEAAVTSFIARLSRMPALLDVLKHGAQQTADAWPDWSESGRQFTQAITRLSALPPADRTALGVYSRRIWHLLHSHWIECEERAAAIESDDTAGRLRSVEETLGKVYASSSWRVTRPARVVIRLLRERGYARRLVDLAMVRARQAVRWDRR